jgi:hypothetical protein
MMSFLQMIYDSMGAYFGFYAAVVLLFGVFILFSMLRIDSVLMIPLLSLFVLAGAVYTGTMSAIIGPYIGIVGLIMAMILTFSIWRLIR